jgi:hypothetical protein
MLGNCAEEEKVGHIWPNGYVFSAGTISCVKG